jgi:TonB family protein
MLLAVLGMGCATSSPPPVGGKKEVIVMGSLDKAAIRDVIHRHREEIVSCYDQGRLVMGKVVVKFVIAAPGNVSSAEVFQSTMSDERLERCIVERVRTWEFPKPTGGGIVKVTYPFLFKPSPSSVQL